MSSAEALALAQIIWDYMKLDQTVGPADVIVMPGSNDPRVAARAIELYQQKFAPLIVFSGGYGRLSNDYYQMPEADYFAAIAKKEGVPARDVLVENKSTNTGENIRFTKRLLTDKGILPRSIILVQKPYMERRVYAAFMKQWPNKYVVTSPNLPLAEYFTELLPSDLVIDIMVSDLARIKLYAELGYQTPQVIPAEVWDAHNKLIALGYNHHLPKEEV